MPLPRKRVTTPMRRPWFLLFLALILAACGGNPEQVVIPTQAVLETETPVPTTAPTTPPIEQLEPTPRPQRQAAPPPGASVQVAAMGLPGSLDGLDAISPGDIYVVEPATNAVIRLTIDPANDSGTTWTPDGARVLFTSDRAGTPQIFAVNATNTNPVQRLSAFPNGDQREPTVSADGLNVAFTSARGGADAIYRMGATDGRGVQQLTFNPTRDYQPDWSPDNTWIVHTSERDGNPEIYIMDNTGGQVQRLTNHPANDTQPAFSPDGRQVAFVSDRSGMPQIYVMDLPAPRAAFEQVSESAALDLTEPGLVPPLNLDASALPPAARPITADPFPKSHPSWYRTLEGGFQLVYAAETDLGNGQVYTQLYAMGSDGSNITPLTEPFISLGAPSVRPGTPAE